MPRSGGMPGHSLRAWMSLTVMSGGAIIFGPNLPGPSQTISRASRPRSAAAERTWIFGPLSSSPRRGEEPLATLEEHRRPTIRLVAVHQDLERLLVNLAP